MSVIVPFYDRHVSKSNGNIPVYVPYLRGTCKGKMVFGFGNDKVNEPVLFVWGNQVESVFVSWYYLYIVLLCLLSYEASNWSQFDVLWLVLIIIMASN